jgi:hypothetical protein
LQSSIEFASSIKDESEPTNSGKRKKNGGHINAASESTSTHTHPHLDPIREFALDELKRSGEDQTLSAYHAGWAVELAESQSEKLLNEEQSSALEVLTCEAANLREALVWAKMQGNAETALRLTGALWRVMEIKGFYKPACEQLQMALKLPGADSLHVLRSKSLSGLSVLAYRQGDLKRSKTYAIESPRKPKTGAAVWHFGWRGKCAQGPGQCRKQTWPVPESSNPLFGHFAKGTKHAK